MKGGDVGVETAAHVLQIKDWYFEVSWFNRSGLNSGWLMSNVIYMPEKEKTNLIKFYQP